MAFDASDPAFPRGTDPGLTKGEYIAIEFAKALLTNVSPRLENPERVVILASVEVYKDAIANFLDSL